MVEGQSFSPVGVMVRYPRLYTSEEQVRNLVQRLEEFVCQLSAIDGWEIEPAFILPSQRNPDRSETSAV